MIRKATMYAVAPISMRSLLLTLCRMRPQTTLTKIPLMIIGNKRAVISNGW